jgi:hypothetical protein
MAADGLTIREIASKVKRAVGVVQRHLDAVKAHWRAQADDSYGEVAARLVARHERTYAELIAQYRASAQPQIVERREYDVLIEATPAAADSASNGKKVTRRNVTRNVTVAEPVNPIEAGGLRKMPGSVRIIQTITPPDPKVALVVEAGNRLDAIAKLLGCYKPIKTAATTPDGKESAPTSVSVNFNYIDVSRIDPETMPPEVQDWWVKKLLQDKTLVVSQAQVIEGQVSSASQTIGPSDSMPPSPAEKPSG